MFIKLSNVAVILILLASYSNLTIRIWRLNTAALMIQYLGVFILIGSVWPLELAIIKLLVGWMVSAVLFITLFSLKTNNLSNEGNILPGQVFRGITGILIFLFVNYFTPGVKAVLSDTALNASILSGLILIGMGIFQMGLTSDPLYIIIGLLTFISGFEVLYAIVEVSALLAGLLAGINLGLVMVGTWMLSKNYENGIE